MARRDYYALLGVKRSAGPDEVKKAFRGLARQLHPDTNPEDPDAERRFREVVEAYEVLSDPEQRARFDRLGPLFRPDGRPPSPDDLSEFLSDTVGSIFRRKRPSDDGEDLRYTMSVTLEEAAAGGERRIDVPRKVGCRHCAGEGAEPHGGKKECEACHGSGKSATRRLFRTGCPRCDGRGFVVARRCGQCSGAGRIDETTALKVHVPPGVATGQKLKLAGKGNGGRGKGTPGDLYVLVEIAEHPLFTRRGNDLNCEIPVMLHELALGTELRVPTLDGPTTIRIPAGTPSGKVFRLGRRGMPELGTSKRGDLHVRVNVEVPIGLSAEGKAALSGALGQLGVEAHPARRAFDEAVDGRGPDRRQ